MDEFSNPLAYIKISAPWFHTKPVIFIWHSIAHMYFGYPANDIDLAIEMYKADVMFAAFKQQQAERQDPLIKYVLNVACKALNQASWAELG